MWSSSRHGPFTCASNSGGPCATGIAYKSVVNIFSLRTATWLGTTVVAAGLAATTGCSSSTSTSTSTSTSSSSSGVGASNGTLAVKQIVQATTLMHSYQPDGKVAARTESLTQPDDIVTLG